MTTVLLHGFWGQPADWNRVLGLLPLDVHVLAPDLHVPGPLAPTVSLGEWPKRFWHWLEHEIGGEKVALVGYSMGARLALAATVQAPERVGRALLVSGRPLLPEAEHAARLAWEEKLARDFQNKPWPELETQWQEQPVFAGSAPTVRRHDPALREILALSLTNWSPRHQRFAAEELRALPSTVEWAFGALDQNYSSVAKGLQDLPVRGQITLIPNVGHRVITDQPDFVAAWMRAGGEG